MVELSGKRIMGEDCEGRSPGRKHSGRRYQLQMVGPYDERLTLCSDLLFKIEAIAENFHEERGYDGVLIDMYEEGLTIKRYFSA
jgi:hypothetical protein